MGLDMYLKRCNRTEHNIDELYEAEREAKPDNPKKRFGSNRIPHSM